MTDSQPDAAIVKHPTGIEGFDLISYGGLPRERTTLVAGTAGSAKTVFGAQFLAAGLARSGEAGVFVTFEEPAGEIRRNVRGFGWDVPRWEREGRWAFVDASPRPGEPAAVTGEYDLGGLLARVENAVRRVGARRVVLDALGGLFLQVTDPGTVRREVFRMTSGLKQMGVTAILTAERTEEYGPVTRLEVEEFVSDNVIILRNALDQEKRRRTIEILKFRGTAHQKGEFPFTVSPEHGVVIIPLSAIELKQRSSSVRISSGNEELDRMCGGGFFRDSVVLLSGATGCGKTLLTTTFIAGGVAAGERCLLFAFEESRDQLFRNASGWGVDFARMEAEGKLRVVCAYPEACSLEDHLIRMKAALDEFRPDRVAVDSLSALERVASVKSFGEFVVGLTSTIKHRELAGLFTATTSNLLGGTSVTETHISTITDSIILLRYVEAYGQMRRGLTVLKMRGSMHDRDIREFTIDGRGIHLGRPFHNVSGILSGNFMQAAPGELERMDELVRDETPGPRR